MQPFIPILAAATGAGEALGASTLAQSPDLSGAFFRMCGSLAIVFVALFAVKWGLKRWQSAALMGRAPRLKVLEAKPIGARQSLLVVGYNGERLLLASTPQGVVLVSKLPNEEETETVAEAATAPAQTPFAAAFMQAVATRFAK